MAEASVAQGTKRLQRGINLYWQHREQIEPTGPSSYLVPSCSGNGHYGVELNLQHCTCPDSKQAKLLGERCKHVVAATIAHAKR